MDYLINEAELEALCGLPHIQQLTYLRGIRPYMDVKTGIVGVKRGISLQSISEQLYIEPHQGIKSGSFSRAQVRRALAGLERAGVIALQSEDLKLILKCPLATLGYSVQNKAVTNPSQQAVMERDSESFENTGFPNKKAEKADTVETPKAVTPLLKEDIYIFLLSKFEQFWMAYPEKKSRQQAWTAFQNLQPDESLCASIMQALDTQIKHREAALVAGSWLPPWKYPANWLEKRCWEDELRMDKLQENKRAARREITRTESGKDCFWVPDDSNENESSGNVYAFEQYKAR